MSGSFCRVNLPCFGIDCTLYFLYSALCSSSHRFIKTVTIDIRHTLFIESYYSKARHISINVHVQGHPLRPEHTASRLTMPGSVPGSKEAGCEGSRPPPSNAYVIHARSYASTSLYLFIAGTNLPSCLLTHNKCCGGNSIDHGRLLPHRLQFVLH